MRWKKQILEIVAVIGAAASILGIFGWDALKGTETSIYDHTKSWVASRDVVFFERTRPWVILGVLFIVIIVMVYQNLRARGSSAGRIRLSTFLRRLDPARAGQALEVLHQRFEHNFLAACQQFRDQPQLCNMIQSRTAISIFEGLLDDVKIVVNYLTGADVAVHIKLFEGEHQLENGAISIAKARAKAYARKPSDRELKLSKARKPLRARKTMEVFEIIPGLTQIDQLPPRLTQPNVKIKYNIAYNAVFGTSRHFWVCNDLIRAQKRGKFASSSEDWWNYYRSLAVFLISHPFQPGGDVSPGEVRGLFIVDSWKTGQFEEELTRNVLGFFAHRFYEFFLMIEETQRHLPTQGA